jgi:uroporphyrinogen decarboxylase
LAPQSAVTELGYVMDAVALIRGELKGSVPLIGFSGSPWTLATYMIEGGSSKDFAKTKALAFNEPALMHQLLEKLADAVALYLSAQVESGAQALQIFDTWGGSLSHSAYREFSLRYMKRIIEQLPREADNRKIPVIVFTKGGGQWLEAIADCGADAVGLDWTTDIGEARARVGDRVALQGNMDPSMLFASPERIREEVATILKSFGSGSGHVFNLGHGITPGVNPEHVSAMVDAVTSLSGEYHQSD